MGVSFGAEGVLLTLGVQELGTMYDYLAKVILLGPSAAGKYVALYSFLPRRVRVTSFMPHTLHMPP
jgi:hypothetical protein